MYEPKPAERIQALKELASDSRTFPDGPLLFSQALDLDWLIADYERLAKENELLKENSGWAGVIAAGVVAHGKLTERAEKAEAEVIRLIGSRPATGVVE